MIEYLIDQNATQAAIRAGYTKNYQSAAVQAHNLLKNPKVKSAIDAELAQHRKKVLLTLDDHLNTLAELREGAKAVEQYGAAVNAELGRAKAAGLHIDKHAITDAQGKDLPSYSVMILPPKGKK